MKVKSNHVYVLIKLFTPAKTFFKMLNIIENEPYIKTIATLNKKWDYLIEIEHEDIETVNNAVIRIINNGDVVSYQILNVDQTKK